MSALLLAGIWWWGARRSRQSPGNAELREAGAAPGSGAADREDFPPLPRHETTRDWGVPPLEPLSIRTAEFEPAHFEDLPMTSRADPLEATFDLGAAEHEVAARPFVRVPTLRMDDAVPVPGPGAQTGTPSAAPEEAGSGPASPIQARMAPASTVPPQKHVVAVAPAAPAAPEPPAERPNAAETQRIVGVRVCARGEGRWLGSDVIAALEQQGLTHGRYQVFHRRHGDGRTLFCAASLVEPGTFDIARMPGEEFRGLTLFAVLPGPADPVETLETLIATAAALAESLQGVLQDATGAPLSQQRAEALRDEVALFQSQLAMS